MDKILITGGSGLVGSAFRKIQTTNQFLFHRRSDCDLTHTEDTMAYFMHHKPRYVIHLAANVGGLFKNMNSPVEMLEDNVRMNCNVLRACHAAGVEKVVSCLSTCIFPDKTTYPINEDMLHDGPPHASNAAYAYAKRLLEIQSTAYHQQYGKQFVCVIPTNIYGPHDNFHLEDAHVIPALIHKCYLAKNKDEDFVVAGTGRPLRQFIYSEDLARLILWTLEHYEEPSSLILSPNEEVSIETVARIIARAFHYEHKMVLDTSRPDGQYKKTADNSKLKRLLPSVAFVPVEDGIKNTVQWFMDHYDSCRK